MGQGRDFASAIFHKAGCIFTNVFGNEEGIAHCSSYRTKVITPEIVPSGMIFTFG